jgi:hypothetical protein
LSEGAAGGRAQAGQTEGYRWVQIRGGGMGGLQGGWDQSRGREVEGAGFRGGGQGVQLRRAEGQKKCGEEGRDARWGVRKSE